MRFMQGMWEHVFSENAKWGLSTIKQDHIRQQVKLTARLHWSISLAPVTVSPC